MRTTIHKGLCAAACCLALLLGGCAGGDAGPDIRRPDSAPDVPSAGEYLTFAFDDAAMGFTVTDTRNGKVWGSEMTDSYYNQPDLSEGLAAMKRQLFNVTYRDVYGEAVAVRSTAEEASIAVEHTEGGARLSCTIQVEGEPLCFDIVLSLRGNVLSACIPEDSIRENDAASLITIELFPFLGASVNTENGYVFFPDGCGALYDFKPNPGGRVAYYRQGVYSNVFTSLEEYIGDAESGQKWPMLPVFGVKQGDNAFAGIVTQGQADTTLCFAPSGLVFDASRVYPIFNYRYGSTIQGVGEEQIVRFEDSRRHGDFEIQYAFLQGEDADYSGMARTYRAYLLENGMLKKAEQTPSVSLDILAAILKPSLLWDSTVVATTFSQAGAMVEELGLSDSRVNLLGWQKQGYNVYPSHFPVSGAAGGKSGLKSLIAQVREAGGLLALNDNFLEADDGRKGFSDRNDTIFTLDSQIITNADKNKYLLDFRSAFRMFHAEWLPEAEGLGGAGYNLDNAGRLLYQNNRKDNVLRREEGALVVQAMLREAADSSVLGVGGGNEYVLPYADFLYGIPQSSSNSPLFDRDVPFYQMVVHGYIPYTPEIPGNMSDNYANTCLKWAEYGYVPYYSLGWEDSSVLKDCYSNGVFISRFSDWADRIQDTVQDFQERLGGLAGVPMHKREELSETLVRVVYENGRSVLVKYGDTAAEYEGVRIPAKSFEVTGG